MGIHSFLLSGKETASEKEWNEEAVVSTREITHDTNEGMSTVGLDYLKYATCVIGRARSREAVDCDPVNVVITPPQTGLAAHILVAVIILGFTFALLLYVAHNQLMYVCAAECLVLRLTCAVNSAVSSAENVLTLLAKTRLLNSTEKATAVEQTHRESSITAFNEMFDNINKIAPSQLTNGITNDYATFTVLSNTNETAKPAVMATYKPVAVSARMRLGGALNESLSPPDVASTAPLLKGGAETLFASAKTHLLRSTQQATATEQTDIESRITEIAETYVIADRSITRDYAKFTELTSKSEMVKPAVLVTSPSDDAPERTKLGGALNGFVSAPDVVSTSPPLRGSNKTIRLSRLDCDCACGQLPNHMSCMSGSMQLFNERTFSNIKYCHRKQRLNPSVV